MLTLKLIKEKIMEFSLSFETSGNTDKSVLFLCNYIDPIIEKLEKNDYGKEFDLIGIIPSIREDRFLDSDWKERRLVRPAKKDADIRLIMDYNKFVNASQDEQVLLYVKLIVDSIKVIDKKKKGDFQGQKLIDDILKEVNVKWEDIKDLEELDPRYPLTRTERENNALAKQREEEASRRND
jgi:hypothetical protein